MATTPLVSEGHGGVTGLYGDKAGLPLDEVNRYTLCGGSIL